MKNQFIFSIRLKILVTLLLVVTGVVSLITVSMASLFHADKKTYIHDMTSVLALSTAEDCNSILNSYRERLLVCGRTMTSDTLTRTERKQLLTGYFQDFRDLAAIIVSEEGEETVSVFDTSVLEPAGLTQEAVLAGLMESPLPDPGAEADAVIAENRVLSPGLSVLAMAVRLDANADGPGVVVTALIRLDRIRRLSSRSTAFEVFVLDHRGNLLAHPDADLLGGRTNSRLDERIGSVDDAYSAGMTLEYERDGIEMIAGLAGTDVGGVVSGVQIPKSAAFIASREILNRLIVVALGLLVLAVVLSLAGSRRITRPVERLVAATRTLAKGKFDVQVQVESNDEIGALSTSFNLMAGELRDREVALTEAHTQLIQSEKLAAFGQLGAGVAHEVKNPLAGILACAQFSLRKADPETPVHRNLTLIVKETKRCKSIVDNLLRFARQEKAVLEPMDINRAAEDAMEIVNHQLELHKVKLKRDLGDDLPTIRGNANQLQQVLMNLMMNAQQAMGELGGTVTLVTAIADDGGVEIRVADDGPGIPHDHLKKLFEPFFTTKPSGTGTGLGLSVSYGIVQDHHGTITVESSPGAGATFVIRIPAMKEIPGAAAPESAPAASSKAREAVPSGGDSR